MRWSEGDAPLVTTNHYQALPVERGVLAFRTDGHVRGSLFLTQEPVG